MLSVSQPELDTDDVFDIPSPPPVAPNRFESSFSQPSVSLNAAAELQEARTPVGHAAVPDKAPKAPIATIPELQMDSAASSEENISAHEHVPQSSMMAPGAAAGNQTPPIHPADRPLHPSGRGGTVVVGSTILQHNSTRQHSAPVSEAVGGKTSGVPLQTPEGLGDPFTAGVATTDHPGVTSRPEAEPTTTPGEASAPEAVTSSAVGPKKTPCVVNQDEVYGALYDSLFPQSFTSEVLSSLATPPPQHSTTGHQSQTIVRTLDEYRAESTAPSQPGLSTDSAADGEDPTDPDRISVTGSSRFTSYQNEAESNRGTDLQSRVPPSSLYSTTGRGKQAEPAHSPPQGKLQHFNIKENTPHTALLISAPPVFDYGAAPGRDARVTDSVPTQTPVRGVVRDQTSSLVGSPSAVPQKKPIRNPEWKTPAAPGDMDGFLSPTYLSVGSDDGSVMDIYYSAEEDNTESADDEMYTMDEGGVQMADRGKTGGLHTELQQQGDTSGRTVQKSGEGETQDGHGSETHLRGDRKFLDVMVRMKEEGKEMREEKLLAKPVQQVNKRMVCDFVPPSAEIRGQLEDSQELRASKLEREAPPNSEQLSSRQPLVYLTRRNCVSNDTRQEVILNDNSAEAKEQVLITAKAEEGGKEGQNADSSCTTSTATDTAALVTASMTRTGSAAQHNRVPQNAEWVDTITQNTGRIRTLQPAAFHLTDSPRTATTVPSGSPDPPAGAQRDPSPG